MNLAAARWLTTLTPRARATLLILCVGLLIGLLTPPRRLADASTYILMADSLCRDGDLTYAPDDLARARALQFADLPNGLFLTKHAWGYAYGKPLLYPLLASPFYAVFGVRGFNAFNGVLLAALLLLGADIVSHCLPWSRALAVAAVVLGFSVTPAYLHWIDPFLLGSVLAAGLVAAARRGRPWLTGVLVAALAACRPPYAALALAPVGLFVFERRWRALATFAIAAAVVGALLLSMTRVVGGQWSPYTGERLFYVNTFPYQVPGGESAIGRPMSIDLPAAQWPGIGPVARSNLYFFLGRFAGVLVYFPTLLACLLWSRGWDREKLLWLLALLAACEALQLALPHNMIGGGHTLGNRLFVLLPVGLAFVDFVAWRPWRAIATAALLLIAVPVVEAPVYFSLNPGSQIVEVPYRFLPLEWTQALRIGYPVRFPGLNALTFNQYAWEGDGVWTRGGTTAEFVLFGSPAEAPRVELSSYLPTAQVSDGGVPLGLEWRPGKPVVITLSHPVVAFRDERNGGRREVIVYSLTIDTAGGTPAATVTDGSDNRSLGVFVHPLPAAPQ